MKYSFKTEMSEGAIYQSNVPAKLWWLQKVTRPETGQPRPRDKKNNA